MPPTVTPRKCNFPAKKTWVEGASLANFSGGGWGLLLRCVFQWSCLQFWRAFLTQVHECHPRVRFLLPFMTSLVLAVVLILRCGRL